MKKKLIIPAICFLLTSSMNAGSIFAVTYSSIGDCDGGYGFTYGFQGSVPSAKLPEGLEWGGYLDINYFSLDDIKSLNDSIGYSGDFGLLLDYNFQKLSLPLDVYAGAGYGIGVLGDSNGYDGINYQAGMTYHFNEKHGFGIKYTHNNMDLILGELDGGLDMVMIYWDYKNKN